MKNSTLMIFCLFFLMLWIAGCSTGQPPHPQETKTPTRYERPTASQIVQQFTKTPPVAGSSETPVALTATLTPPAGQTSQPESGVETNCLILQPGRPEETSVGSFLLFDWNSTELLLFSANLQDRLLVADFAQKDRSFFGDQIYISPDTRSFTFTVLDKSTRPAKVYLMYLLPGDTQPQQRELNVEKLGEFPSLVGWLNNRAVAFLLPGDPGWNLLSMDLISGEEVELTADYPEMLTGDPWSWTALGRTLYTPNLRYVIYPTINNENGHGYILWDRLESKRVTLLVTGHSSLSPGWAPDGQSFAVATTLQYLTIVDIAGNQRELGLGDYFPNQYPAIRAWSWSPDSRSIALWIDFYDNEDRARFGGGSPITEKLYLLNVGTNKITDYCITGDLILQHSDYFTIPPKPIWSPDGSKLLVEQRFDLNNRQIVIIDLNLGTYYVAARNTYPASWLNR